MMKHKPLLTWLVSLASVPSQNQRYAKQCANASNNDTHKEQE